MSSPNFPGPSWQNKPDFSAPFDDTGLYRDEPAGGARSAPGGGGVAGDESRQRGSDGRGSYDRGGYDRGSYGQDGYGRGGYEAGYNGGGAGSGAADGHGRRARRGSDRNGYDGSRNARAGYDEGGYDRAGYDRAGYDRAGYDRAGYDRAGYDQAGRAGAGPDGAGRDGAGRDGAGYGRAGSNGGRPGAGSAPEPGQGYGAGANGAGGRAGYDRNGYDSGGNPGGGYRGRDDRGGQRYGASPAGRTATSGRDQAGAGNDYVGPPDYVGSAQSGQPGYQGTATRRAGADGGASYRDGGDWEQASPGRRRGAGTGSPGGLADPDGRPPRTPGSWYERLWRASWWRHWTLQKAVLVTGSLAVLMVLVLIAGFFYIYSSVSVPKGVLNTKLAQSSEVYFADGQEVGCFCSVNRTVLTQAQVQKSTMLVAAAVAAEDRNFFHEGGVSMTGILRAAKNDIFGSGSLQGGSTITEELVKQYYDSADNGNLTYKEKINEIVVSIKLAQEKSKWWVMTHYLNTIYFGAGALGAQAAAETYFGEPAWKLDAAQAAMLGAMIQSPSDYDPTHPDKSVPGLGSLAWRWKNEVLANMVKDGAISQATAAGLKFPTVHIRPPATTWPGYRGYIMTLVQNELSGYYGISASQIGSLGLQIHTTINERMMNHLYAAIHYEKQQMKAYGAALPWYVSIGAVVEKPGSGAIVAFYGGPNYDLKKKRCLKIHCQNPTILDHAPVGSSFKPYVLATAVADGMDAQDSITNSHSPLCIPPADDTSALQLQLSKQTLAGCDTPDGYYAFNEPSENTPGVNLNVAQATASSNNASYMDLIHRTSVNSVIDMAQRLGVYSTTITGLKSLFWSCNGCKDQGQFPGAVNAALGEGSMTAVDQANTFATLVSGGISATPHVIDYVTRNGTRLPSKVVKQRVLTRAQAADTDWALSFDTNAAYHGTGVPNAVWDRPMIAKTGTLGTGSNSAAAWFLGAIPQYSMAVGMFTDHPATQFLDGLPSIGGWTGGYGGAWPATIWHDFMSKQFVDLKVKQLPTPKFGLPFTKWDQAPPIKKKKCPAQNPGLPGNGNGGGNGPGNGNGHHHHGFGGFAAFPGKGKNNCKNPGGSTSPSPSPSPSTSISPSPSPSISISPSTSPSISPSVSPSGIPPFAKTASSVRSHKAPQRPSQQSAVNLPSLFAVATLANSELRKPTWIALTTGLI